jgi:hypothetical protein
VTRWTKGEAEVERLLADRHLERVSGAQADGTPHVERARTTLASARRLADTDAVNAFTLAYDALRLACTGLLAQQGLRSTTDGGHYAVERAVRAQFETSFADFGPLRRRRHELEYPAYGGDLPEAEEVAAAIATAERLVEACAALLPGLGLF